MRVALLFCGSSQQNDTTTKFSTVQRSCRKRLLSPCFETVFGPCLQWCKQAQNIAFLEYNNRQ